MAEGFAQVSPPDPFLAQQVRLFALRGAEETRFRLTIEPHHCNAFGTAHGGFLSTLADLVLAANLLQQLPATAHIVTARLEVDFLRPVATGSWLESRLDGVKLGPHRCRIQGVLLREGAAAVSMVGLFALIDGPQRG